MTKKVINVGSSANAGNGDPLRVAFGKVNDNFTELYTALGVDGSVFNPLNVDSNIVPDTDNSRDLGTPEKQWRHVYTAGGSIYLDNIKLTNVNGKFVATKVVNPGEENEEEDPEDSDATSDIGGGSSDRLVNGEHELVLIGGGSPFVTFPESAGESIYIQGNEIASSNGDLAATAPGLFVINTNAQDS